MIRKTYMQPCTRRFCSLGLSRTSQVQTLHYRHPSVPLALDCIVSQQPVEIQMRQIHIFNVHFDELFYLFLNTRS